MNFHWLKVGLVCDRARRDGVGFVFTSLQSVNAFRLLIKGGKMDVLRGGEPITLISPMIFEGGNRVSREGKHLWCPCDPSL